MITSEAERQRLLCGWQAVCPLNIGQSRAHSCDEPQDEVPWMKKSNKSYMYHHEEPVARQECLPYVDSSQRPHRMTSPEAQKAKKRNRSSSSNRMHNFDVSVDATEELKNVFLTDTSVKDKPCRKKRTSVSKNKISLSSFKTCFEEKTEDNIHTNAVPMQESSNLFTQYNYLDEQQKEFLPESMETTEQFHEVHHQSVLHIIEPSDTYPGKTKPCNWPDISYVNHNGPIIREIMRWDAMKHRDPSQLSRRGINKVGGQQQGELANVDNIWSSAVNNAEESVYLPETAESVWTSEWEMNQRSEQEYNARLQNIDSLSNRVTSQDTQVKGHTEYSTEIIVSSMQGTVNTCSSPKFINPNQHSYFDTSHEKPNGFKYDNVYNEQGTEYIFSPETARMEHVQLSLTHSEGRDVPQDHSFGWEQLKMKPKEYLQDFNNCRIYQNIPYDEVIPAKKNVQQQTNLTMAQIEGIITAFQLSDLDSQEQNVNKCDLTDIDEDCYSNEQENVTSNSEMEILNSQLPNEICENDDYPSEEVRQFRVSAPDHQQHESFPTDDLIFILPFTMINNFVRNILDTGLRIVEFQNMLKLYFARDSFVDSQDYQEETCSNALNNIDFYGELKLSFHDVYNIVTTIKSHIKDIISALNNFKNTPDIPDYTIGTAIKVIISDEARIQALEEEEKQCRKNLECLEFTQIEACQENHTIKRSTIVFNTEKLSTRAIENCDIFPMRHLCHLVNEPSVIGNIYEPIVIESPLPESQSVTNVAVRRPRHVLKENFFTRNSENLNISRKHSLHGSKSKGDTGDVTEKKYPHRKRKELKFTATKRTENLTNTTKSVPALIEARNETVMVITSSTPVSSHGKVNMGNSTVQKKDSATMTFKRELGVSKTSVREEVSPSLVNSQSSESLSSSQWNQ